MPNKLKASILALAALVLVTVVALIINNAGNQAKDTKLTFVTTPNKVTVKVDGQELGELVSGETTTVPLQEEVDIEVAREGFTTYTSSATVTPGTPHTITAILQPETNEARAVLEEEQQGEFERETTEQYLENAARAYEENPILHDLPSHGELFSAYHGVSEAKEHDFAIHVYLYKGSEQEGREEFSDWLASEQYEAEDYDIVEHFEDDQPQRALGDAPTWEDLIKLTPESVAIEPVEEASELEVDEVSRLFAETATTWDTATDIHHTDGLQRAANLMTEEAQETIFTPNNPTTNPAWREASGHAGRSYPWLTYFEKEETSKGAEIEMDICWAWVTNQEDYAIIDGPRTMTITMTDTMNGPQVSQFDYEKPDPFVDNSNSSCRPEDAPAAP